nr:hypothetical protein [Bacillus pseudomycoides]
MKLTKEERIQITFEIGDIIEQQCRRCYYNRSDDACFSAEVARPVRIYAGWVGILIQS